MNRAALKTTAKERLGNGIFKTEWLYGLLYLFVATVFVSAVSVTGIGAILVVGAVVVLVSKKRMHAYSE